jgi:hypothetical protein
MYSFSFASVSTCVSFAFVCILPSSNFCFRSYSALLTFSDISSAPSLSLQKSVPFGREFLAQLENLNEDLSFFFVLNDGFVGFSCRREVVFLDE